MRSFQLAARSARYISGYLDLLTYAARHANVLRLQPIRDVFNRQVYFTGIDALKPVALLALMSGALVATQVTALTGNNSDLVVNILAWVIVREFGPLIIAIIIIARSSAAIASELALMRINNEIQSIEIMGISHYNYLLVPRILGVALSVAALNIYFQAIAISGGLLFSTIFQHISYWEHLNKFFDTISPLDFLISLIKGMLFGAAISTSACFHGMSVTNSITEIPRATTLAVTNGILIIFLLDAIFACAAFMLH